MPRHYTHSYRKHSTRDIAIVQIKGKRYPLGKYNSPESFREFHRVLAQHAFGDEADSVSVVARHSPVASIAQFVTHFLSYADARYRKFGEPTSEPKLYRIAARPLLALFAHLPSKEFSPRHLKACQEFFREQGHCRKKVNQHVTRIRRMIRWGNQFEYTTVPQWLELKVVECVTAAEQPDRPKVEPAPEHLVAAVEQYVSPTIWAMIQFQLLTGARPGEACIVREMDIDSTDGVWEYRPFRWKTQHREKSPRRVLLLGPQAQELIRAWLTKDPTDFLWRPEAGRQSYLENVRNPKRAKHHRNERRRLRPFYSTIGYATAVTRACERAFPVDATWDEERQARWRVEHHWSPNQLRHNAATRIRALFGLEMARIILGHTSAVTTEIYAKADLDKARDIMRQFG